MPDLLLRFACAMHKCTSSEHWHESRQFVDNMQRSGVRFNSEQCIVTIATSVTCLLSPGTRYVAFRISWPQGWHTTEVASFLQEAVTCLPTEATLSAQTARSASTAVQAFLNHPAVAQTLVSGARPDDSSTYQPGSSGLVHLTGSNTAEETGRLRLIWASCARAAIQEAVLAVPADWTGARPGSVLQQSFWRHTHPQVCHSV